MAIEMERASTWPAGAPATATRSGSRIDLSWSTGASKSVNVTWLRDNCPCTECRITQTGEHRYFLGATATAPEPSSVALLDGSLVIDWADGHRSTYAPADFDRIVGIASRRHVRARPWSDDFMPERFDHDQVIGDVAVRRAFLEATIRDGMTVITNMATESGECIRFLEKLSLPVRDTPFDRLHDVFFRADGYNVAHTDEPLPPHNDFASYTWPPSGQLLHMLVNDVAGGEWVNVDGFRVIEQLQARDPAAIDVLARVMVGFREHSDSAESWTRSPIVRRDGTGTVVGVRFSNQLMQPLDPTDPDLEAFYDAYHQLARAVNDPANQIVFRGDAGMMQVVHGHRVLHARKGFDGTSGARHLQDTYFEFDDVRALHARMTGAAR